MLKGKILTNEAAITSFDDDTAETCTPKHLTEFASINMLEPDAEVKANSALT